MIKGVCDKEKPANTSFICKPINPKCMSLTISYSTHMPTQYFPVPNEPRSTYQTGDSLSDPKPTHCSYSKPASSNLFTLPSLPSHGNPSSCGLCFPLLSASWIDLGASTCGPAQCGIPAFPGKCKSQVLSKAGQLSLHLSPHHT